MCNIDNLSGVYIFQNISPGGNKKRQKSCLGKNEKKKERQEKEKKKRGKEKRKITINSPNLGENLGKKVP